TVILPGPLGQRGDQGGMLAGERLPAPRPPSDGHKAVWGSPRSAPASPGGFAAFQRGTGSAGQVQLPARAPFSPLIAQLYELDGDPRRKEFLDDLFSFMQKRGTPVNRIPIMAKQVLDLYMLYTLVTEKGGLVEVINKKLWREITKGLNLPTSITSAAFTLRTQYMKYLYPYECEKRGLSNPNELQAAIDSNRREGRRQGFGSSLFTYSPGGTHGLLSSPKLPVPALGLASATNGGSIAPVQKIKKGNGRRGLRAEPPPALGTQPPKGHRGASPAVPPPGSAPPLSPQVCSSPRPPALPPPPPPLPPRSPPLPTAKATAAAAGAAVVGGAAVAAAASPPRPRPAWPCPPALPPTTLRLNAPGPGPRGGRAHPTAPVGARGAGGCPCSPGLGFPVRGEKL
uniref:AT-rich interactive domain-containing protein 3 n=1 Tax=Strix occidentalis caurina TaxID=311401 RepID=A0A8D0ELE7_STROC